MAFHPADKTKQRRFSAVCGSGFGGASVYMQELLEAMNQIAGNLCCQDPTVSFSLCNNIYSQRTPNYSLKMSV